MHGKGFSSVCNDCLFLLKKSEANMMKNSHLLNLGGANIEVLFFAPISLFKIIHNDGNNDCIYYVIFII